MPALQHGDHEIPAEWRDEWAAQLAQRDTRTPAVGQPSRWMTFRLGEQRLALTAAHVVRSHAPGPTHRLPGRNSCLVSTVMQMEGRVVLMADLARCLGLDTTAARQGTRVLELDAPPATYALLVDEVMGIVEVDSAAIQATPAHLPAELQPVMHGVWRDEAGPVMLIDAPQLAASLDADLGSL